MRLRLPPLLGIFLTVFIDLLSFGLVIPDIQLRGEALGGKGVVLGLMIASFSIAQLLVAPVLGRWSDTIGRRGILLATSLISMGSFVAYGHADVLWLMFAARVLSGMGSANIGVAYAYVADVTRPEDRAKGMGLLGAAFGLGFIFGPIAGAFLAGIDHRRHLEAMGLPGAGADSLQAFGGQPLVLGYAAAALCLLNFLYVLLFLPESLKGGVVRSDGPRGSSLQNMAKALATPGLGLLLGLFFAYGFAFSNLESTYFRLAVQHFHLTQEHGALILTVVGIVSAVMQGVVVRMVTPRFGEVRLVRFAFLLQVPVIAMVPHAPPWLWQMIAVVLLGIGAGLSQPALSSLISRSAPPEMQGGIFGVTQALGALARIAGPLVANGLYDRFGVAYPYLAAGLVMLVPALGAFRIGEPGAEQPRAA